MKISAKQDSIAEQIARGKKEIALEGAVGTSKTYGAALVLLGIALDYPNSLIFVARRHLPELRRGTLFTFEEAAADMGLIKGQHYIENKTTPYWRIETHKDKPASYIYFVELDHIRDPQFLKVKSANITCGMIDEADGVIENAFNTFHSRTGRRNKNGAPDFTIISCNANDGWIKRRYYDKFKNPSENGPLPPEAVVIEFDIADSFLEKEYYDKLMGNPKQWVERYLRNNWDYGDDETSLFKYRHLDSVHVRTFDRGAKSVAFDVARSAKGDRSTIGRWENGALVDIKIVKDYGVEMDTAEQGDILHDYCVENEVGYEDIIVDFVGLGEGVWAHLKHEYGWTVDKFVAGSKPAQKVKQEELKKRGFTPKDTPIGYNNLRSEQTYLLARAIEKAEVHFWDGCPYLAEFKKEATMHDYDTKDKMLVVESKDKVKLRTGHSPDIFDCVMMGYYKHMKTLKRRSPGGATRTKTSKQPAKKKEPIVRLSTKGRPITRGLRDVEF